MCIDRSSGGSGMSKEEKKKLKLEQKKKDKIHGKYRFFSSNYGV
jgi:hypothetical protein